MKQIIETIDKKIEEVEANFQVRKDALFKTKEALDVLNKELSMLRGERKALEEIREEVARSMNKENKLKK